MKKDKKEESMNPKFHWGGLDLQHRQFSAFLGQMEASAKRPRSASHALEEECKKKKTTKKHQYLYAHPDRETTKNFWEYWLAKGVMIRILKN